MYRECSQDKDLHILLEDEYYQEDFITYVKFYYDITPTYEQKRIRKFMKTSKKKSNRRTFIMKIHSAYISPSTAMI